MFAGPSGESESLDCRVCWLLGGAGRTGGTVGTHMWQASTPSRTANNKPEVSGRAFLGIIRYVKEKHSPAELTKAISDAGDATRRAFDRRIQVVDWFPYEAF